MKIGSSLLADPSNSRVFLVVNFNKNGYASQKMGGCALLPLVGGGLMVKMQRLSREGT